PSSHECVTHATPTNTYAYEPIVAAAAFEPAPLGKQHLRTACWRAWLGIGIADLPRLTEPRPPGSGWFRTSRVVGMDPIMSGLSMYTKSLNPLGKDEPGTSHCPLPHYRQARPGRHGRSLACHRYQAQPRCGRQNPARGVRPRCRAHGALHARG